MPKTSVAALAIMSLAVLADDAFAVDIANGDSRAHKIAVHKQGRTTILTIEPGRTLFDVCDKCVLKIRRGNELTLKGDTVAVIVNGRLVLQNSNN